MVINAKTDKKSLAGAVDFKAGYNKKFDTLGTLESIVDLNGKKFFMNFSIINFKTDKATGTLLIAEPDAKSDADVYVQEENMTCTLKGSFIKAI